MNDSEIRKKLNDIAKMMKKPGANLEQLSAEIDKLLGTTPKQEDKALAREWENRTRRARR